MKLKSLVLVAMIGMQQAQAVNENDNKPKPFYKKASTYLYFGSALCGIGAIYSFWKTGGAWPTKNPSASSLKDSLPGIALVTTSFGLAAAARNPRMIHSDLD